MYPRIIAFLLGMFFVAHANAMAYHWGLPGSREGNIQSITITEFAPSPRTVTLTKPDEAIAFARQFDLFSLYIPKKWGADFYKVFPVRYRITVQQDASTYVFLLVAVDIKSVPKIRTYGSTTIESNSKKRGINFQLWVPESDGSFSEYSQEAGHWFEAGATPLEQALAHLFPPA